MNYEYVPQSDRHMTFARDIAKACFKVWGWDKKTQPVAVIVKDHSIVSWAITADGMHALQKACDRELDKGSPYEDCEWCMPGVHAEALAVARSTVKLDDAACYVWGHYKMCDHCIRVLDKAGVKRFILMKDCENIFDRHRPGHLVGRPEKFLL